MLAEDCELVAPQTRRQAVSAYGLSQPLGDHDQQVIAHPVPVDIVNSLEAIEIQKKYCVTASAVRRSLDRGVQRFIELAAIGKASQGILESSTDRLYRSAATLRRVSRFCSW